MVNGKTKKKAIEQSGVRKGSPMEGVGLWREGFKEKVFFEFRVEKSRSDGQWQTPYLIKSMLITAQRMAVLSSIETCP